MNIETVENTLWIRYVCVCVIIKIKFNDIPNFERMLYECILWIAVYILQPIYCYQIIFM